jgi:hypothetical protein
MITNRIIYQQYSAGKPTTEDLVIVLDDTCD